MNLEEIYLRELGMSQEEHG